MTKRPLDKTDIAILAALYKDARMNNKDIAVLVGLAPSSCLERIKKLQSEQVIKGAQLHVDFQALGGNIQVMISIRLSDHSRPTVDTFQDQLAKLPEVISLYHMGGENDFLLHASLRDTEHLRDFVFNAITARNEVNHVETALIYNQVNGTELPKV
ncbi:Lrp/AsnC family transcriptional regulator [uncultured Paraglaciecola sp.]|uniref:Lrp/AsnC family transcriptional regulator n=1 Tax=uncultured Paraglaciecola sp. TaxID=1765024 RepID=UPI0030D8D7D8|tara:strand:- start:60578 stop:61045 length:468 start_codon:yes stop_codon:yes gene_type:complete